MAMEKNGRIRDNAFENWAPATPNLQSQSVHEGEWTVRLWSDESAPLASAAMDVERAIPSPDLSASMAGGFQDGAPDATIHIEKTNTMLYL